MTKAAKEFNEQYDLKVSDAAFKAIDLSNVISQDLSGKPKKNWKENFKRFFTKPVYVGGLIVFLVIIILSIVLPLFSQWDADEKVSSIPNHSQFIKNLPSTLNPIVTKTVTSDQLTIYLKLGDRIDLVHTPGLIEDQVTFNAWKLLEVTSEDKFTIHESVIGTDSKGRDFWVRTWAGTWRSLQLALVVTVVTTTIGMSIGSFIGLYVGTLIDIIFIKILAIYNSIPTIVWYGLILFLLPPGYLALFTVFIVTGWMSGLSVSRLYMWKYVNSDFMKAAETVGVRKLGRIFKHALPHYFGYIAYGLVSSIPATIFGEASLAFIGLSPNPDRASLGNALNEARQSILGIVSNPVFLLLPTMILFTLTISLHFVAMGVNDALEPKFKKKT